MRGNVEKVPSKLNVFKENLHFSSTTQFFPTLTNPGLHLHPGLHGFGLAGLVPLKTFVQVNSAGLVGGQLS